MKLGKADLFESTCVLVLTIGNFQPLIVRPERTIVCVCGAAMWKEHGSLDDPPHKTSPSDLSP